jgi:hypothetical protein
VAHGASRPADTVAHEASRPAAAEAHGARPLTPWGTMLCLSHAKGPLLAAPTTVGYGVMYSFAKFVTDHIFLQKRDKINIKTTTR